MLFSNLQVEFCFDAKNILQFYEDLKTIYPNNTITIVWRNGLRKTDDLTAADSVVIKKDSHNILSANYQKSKAILKLSALKDKEQEVLRSIRNNNLTFVESPGYTTGIICALLYCIIYLFLLASDLNAEILVIFFLALVTLVIGMISYSIVLATNRNITLLRITSIITLIGILPLAPGSMLFAPLLLAISKNVAFKMINRA